MRRVFSFLKARKVWLLSFFGAGIVCFYSYYWFVVLQQTNNTNVVLEENDTKENTIAIEIDNFEEIRENKIAQEIENHASTDFKSFNYPDILQIMHVTRLMALEKSLKEEKDKETSANIAKETLFPKIAIVIDDMGASPKRTQEIINLEAPLTASFVTFAPQLEKQIQQSKESGHEIMIHVPMQPKSNIYVSEDVLTINMSPSQIKNAFLKMLAKFGPVVGINNHMGSEFTEHADKLEPIVKVLEDQQLFFLDSKTTPNSQVENVAKKYNVPCLHRHIFLDNENNLEYILKQLEKTEHIAQKNGYAIAIGHPKTQTSQALAIWLKALEKKKIQLVPLSHIITQYLTDKEIKQ